MSYVDYEYYTNTYGGTSIAADNAPRALQKASDTVDTLTYCRIVERGIDGLTPFQKGIVQRVVCALAEWQEDNADLLEAPYNSYAINGVSVSLGEAKNVRQIGGVMIPSGLYAELIKTGLCYRGV
jgi:hypothetical protein